MKLTFVRSVKIIALVLYEGAFVKPRIIKLRGIWHCGVRGIPNKRIGVGYTPKAAYLDWLGVGHG